MKTAPTPATAVRHRLLVAFGANRPPPASSLSLITHHTDERSSTINQFSKKNQVNIFFLASLCWHRREAQFLLFLFSLPFGRGAMLPAGKRWLVHASQPHLPIHALFCVPSVLAYNTREAPYSSLGRPKWPKPA